MEDFEKFDLNKKTETVATDNTLPPEERNIGEAFMVGYNLGIDHACDKLTEIWLYPDNLTLMIDHLKSLKKLK